MKFKQDDYKRFNEIVQTIANFAGNTYEGEPVNILEGQQISQTLIMHFVSVMAKQMNIESDVEGADELKEYVRKDLIIKFEQLERIIQDNLEELGR